jgi:hypothetical protein
LSRSDRAGISRQDTDAEPLINNEHREALMKISLRSILLVGALTASAIAQQSTPPATNVPATNAPAPGVPPTDVPATREDIQRLFETMRVQEQIRNSMEMMLTQQRKIIAGMMKKRNRRVTEADVDRASESAQEFLKNFPLDEMVQDMIPVYQNHLTKTDVDVMTAFYGSPTGQKLLREQPTMAGESMQAVAVRVQKALELAMDHAEQKAKEDDAHDLGNDKTPPAEKPEQQKN